MKKIKIIKAYGKDLEQIKPLVADMLKSRKRGGN